MKRDSLLGYGLIIYTVLAFLGLETWQLNSNNKAHQIMLKQDKAISIMKRDHFNKKKVRKVYITKKEFKNIYRTKKIYVTKPIIDTEFTKREVAKAVSRADESAAATITRELERNLELQQRIDSKVFKQAYKDKSKLDYVVELGLTKEDIGVGFTYKISNRTDLGLVYDLYINRLNVILSGTLLK